MSERGRLSAILLAMLLVPMLLFGAMALRDRAGRQAVLPGLAPADVARIEMAQGRAQVVLQRRPEGWVVLSAADAPASEDRINALFAALADLRGRPLAGTVPPQRREPLRLRLLDSRGEPIGDLGFWATEVRALPDGPRLAIDTPPALALWPSAWSTLQPPRIDPAKIARVERLTLDGPVQLADADAARVADMLGRLSATGFVAGATVDWRGGRMLRVTLVDGAHIDLQQVPDGEGWHFLRLTSDTEADVRRVRRFAFRVSEALP